MNERPTPETDEDADDLASAIGGFIDRLKRDLAEAREELEDWRNAAKGAENPHPDEKHCTCVPLLHKQLKDAREAFAIVTDQLVQEQIKNRRLREAIRETHEALETASSKLAGWHGLYGGQVTADDYAAGLACEKSLAKLQPFLDA